MIISVRVVKLSNALPNMFVEEDIDIALVRDQSERDECADHSIDSQTDTEWRLLVRRRR